MLAPRKQTCMDGMNMAEVRRVRAAYGLAATEPIGPTERDELASLLIAGTREYDLDGPEYVAWRAKHEEEYMVQPFSAAKGNARPLRVARASAHGAKRRSRRRRTSQRSSTPTWRRPTGAYYRSCINYNMYVYSMV